MLAQEIQEDLILTILSIREIHMATSRQHGGGHGCHTSSGTDEHECNQ